MAGAILDATAVLAVLLGGRGGEAVRPHLAGASVSAVNYSEVLAVTARRCGSPGEARRRVDRRNLAVVPFDAEQAAVTASLVPATRPFGLSLADRACLSLGRIRGQLVLTADGDWANLDIGVTVEVIR